MGAGELPRLNLSQRLFLITLVALIPTVVILGYNLVSLRAAEERAMHAQALRVAQLASLEMNQIIRGTEYLLRAIGSAQVVQRSDAAECNDYVASIGRQLPQFVALAVIEGTASSSARPSPRQGGSPWPTAATSARHCAREVWW